MDQQHRIALRLLPGSGEAGQRGRRPVEPERVAVDDEERRRAQHLERRAQRAAGVEQRLLAAQHDARPAGPVRREMVGDLLGVPVDVDHHLSTPAAAQPVERVVEQRAPAERQQRLGGVRR